MPTQYGAQRNAHLGEDLEVTLVVLRDRALPLAHAEHLQARAVSGLTK